MTLGGTVNLTSLLLLVAVITATFAWGQSVRDSDGSGGFVGVQPPHRPPNSLPRR